MMGSRASDEASPEATSQEAFTAPSFAQLYAAHAAFVWRSLRRLGAREADVEDVSQEVFVIAHRRLVELRYGSPRAWLFAIVLRVASDYRKRAYVRREVQQETGEPSIAETQSAYIDRAREWAFLQSVLAALEEDKRAIFVGYELEGMSMKDLAAALDCPVQTAYSRLHAAREHVTAAIERWHRRSREGL